MKLRLTHLTLPLYLPVTRARERLNTANVSDVSGARRFDENKLLHD